MNDTSTPSSRIQILDIIRGIAVLGILGVNIFAYGMPELLEDALPVTDPDGGLGYSLYMAAEILFSGKMRSLFAMLFGVSSVIILDRMTQKTDGLQASRFFFRRMLWLLVFGQIHGYLFLYHGDILFQYALMGMIAFPFYHASTRVRVAMMLICLAVLTYKPYSEYTYVVELEKEYLEIADRYVPYEELSEDDQRVIDEWKVEAKREDFMKYREIVEQYIPYEELSEEDDEWWVIDEWEGEIACLSPAPEDYEWEVECKQGGYFTAQEYVRDGVVQMATYDLYNWYAWEILLYMLLGVSLFRAGFFREEFASNNLALIAALGLGIGGAAHAWMHLGFYGTFFDFSTSLYYLIFFDLGRLPMVMGYIALIMLVFRFKWLALPGKWLAATGKMTLTNYLMQSIIAACIFIGFRQFNQLNRVQLLLIVPAIWAFQIVFSNLWMRYFTYGPFEWVWRSLTYCRAQPWKRKPAAPPT